MKENRIRNVEYNVKMKNKVETLDIVLGRVEGLLIIIQKPSV